MVFLHTKMQSDLAFDLIAGEGKYRTFDPEHKLIDYNDSINRRLTC